MCYGANSNNMFKFGAIFVVIIMIRYFILEKAMFEAGFPESVPVSTTNRQCSSGLQAIVAIAGELNMGSISFGIAGGVESMTSSGIFYYGKFRIMFLFFDCAYCSFRYAICQAYS